GKPTVSAVTIGELASGLDTPDPIARIARSEVFFESLSNFEIFPFGISEARAYGTLSAMVRAAGRNPRPHRLDLQIAATAVSRSLPLLTRNPIDLRGLEPVVEIIAL
ncbi:MAG: PIN domain-containing protein, partial [Candidatus Dormibacteraceae bacterium]